jgi:prephenate dehydratase
VTDNVTLKADPAASTANEVEFASCPVKLTAAIACDMAADKQKAVISGRQRNGRHQRPTGFPIVGLQQSGNGAAVSQCRCKFSIMGCVNRNDNRIDALLLLATHCGLTPQHASTRAAAVEAEKRINPPLRLAATLS